MPYSATAHRLLISAPSDVEDADIATVIAAVQRWNAIYGPQFGAVVVPVHWRAHTAAEYGVRPQESINQQLVESADIVIALFWHRIGSDTGRAESGTIEEIDEAHDAGAYVAILTCGRDLPPNVDTDQLDRLREFYDRIGGDSLMLDYSDPGTLAQHVDIIISRALTREGARAEAAVSEQATPDRAAEVWPRIETRERTLRGGKSIRDWLLVLSNTGTDVARNVRYRLEGEKEDDVVPDTIDDEAVVEALAPGGDAPFALLVHMGIASQFRCMVAWEDSTGEHENVATLRLF